MDPRSPRRNASPRRGLADSAFPQETRSLETTARVPAPEPARQYRSAYFPIALAAFTAGTALLVLAAPWAAAAAASALAPSAAPWGGLAAAFEVAGKGLLALSVAAGAYAAAELALFLGGVALRAEVSDEEFWRFARKELRRWRLHPSLQESLLGRGPGRGRLRIYRPEGRFAGLAYGFTAGGIIYLRPELIRWPWLFRWVLKHELKHLSDHFVRGPPRPFRGVIGLMRYLAAEAAARVREFLPARSWRGVQVPVLERVLQEARLSLRVGRPYDVLISHPGEAEIRSPEAYLRLSGGEARIRTDEAEGRNRLVVRPRFFETLPEPGSREALKLRRALGRLGRLYIISRQMDYLQRAALPPGSPEYGRLREMSASLGFQWGPQDGLARLEDMIEEMHYRLARQSFAGIGVAEELERIYDSLHHQGAVILPFEPGEPGLGEVERALRYWQAADRGSFALTRVDLPEGGHVLVARKREPRVDLWLRPKEGHALPESITNFDGDPEPFLRAAGFNDADIARFRDADLEIRHVFGADMGENRVFINVRRSHLSALKRYTEESGIAVQNARAGFRLHMQDVIPIHKFDKVWRRGYTGKGALIYVVDTGVDAEHPDFSGNEPESKDFTGEGHEDWLEHGTFVADEAFGAAPPNRGGAPQAKGRMGKVFSQNGRGASDGDIMAAAVDAMKWAAGTDQPLTISLSLGSMGTVDAPLAQFFSNLTKRQAASGFPPVVVASAGNSGPFDGTRSAPSVGEYVASITAAAKSLDDGRPEIAFYSSVGPTLDRRFHRRRYRRPMGGTALGGDVTTPPEVRDVYEHGITAAKSRFGPPSPSDTPDGLHRRMSGTSMAGPNEASAAAETSLASIQAAKASGNPEALAFLKEDLSFANSMVRMRSRADMGLPIFIQEAGLLDAEAAVELAERSFGAPVSRLRRALRWLRGLLLRSAVQEPEEKDWRWIERAREVWRMEDQVYAASEEAYEAAAPEPLAAVQNPDAPREDPHQAHAARRAAGNAAAQAMDRAFSAERQAVLPGLLKALQDPVWLVRLYAAFTLLNLQAPQAAESLVRTALEDPDARVRQTAFLALAATPGSRDVEEPLRSALSDARPDVRLYAAYALSRRGDDSGVERIAEGLQHGDKAVRLTAVWLLGQLGRRAPPEAADALAMRAADGGERGNIRQRAVASLANVAVARPDALTDESILTLLRSAGPQDFALTRTISKFFKAAAQAPSVRARMAEKPLRDDLEAFVHKYKASVRRPGALGEMVRLLAEILNIPLDLPTPIPDPAGVGIAGVDPLLGPVHLIVEAPPRPDGSPAISRFEDFRDSRDAAAEALPSYGLESGDLEHYDARLKAAMPNSQSLWVSLPDAKVTAFTAEMEARGFTVRRSGPMYRMIHETGRLLGAAQARETLGVDGSGVLVAVIGDGGDASHPALGPERARHRRNFTEEGGREAVVSDSYDHETFLMGVIGARSVEGSPYVGVAPGVEFAVGKAVGTVGGSEAAFMAAMEWAASLVDPLENPLIINLSSAGLGKPESPIARLVNRLRLKNIAVIVSANNAGPLEDTIRAPGNAALATTIGSVDKDDRLNDYSGRSSRARRFLRRVNFGGGVFPEDARLYEVVSTLSARLAEALRDAPTTVLHGGQPLYQYRSGGSVAAAHESGAWALAIQRMRALLADERGRLPDGYQFWLDELFDRTARRLEGTSEHEVGAGRTDAAAALAAIEEAAKNPAAVAAEARALIERARREHGEESGPPTAGSWARPFVSLPTSLQSSFLSLLTLFL